MLQVLFGFIPWIACWSLSGPGRWTPAVFGALLTAGVVGVVDGEGWQRIFKYRLNGFCVDGESVEVH